MAKFDYQNAQKTALRLIDKFGQVVKMVRASGDYDPVTGANSNETFQETDATVTPLPVLSNLGLTGDDRFKEELKTGKIRGFYVAASGLGFAPAPGDVLIFEGATWEIAGSTPLNPAAIPVFYTIGCRSGGRQPSDVGQ